jgi:hypothetical protein
VTGAAAQVSDLLVSNLSNQVLRYNGTTGAFLDVFVPAGSGTPGEISPPTGLVFGPDGNLYVSNSATNQVLRYNGTTGAFLDAFVPAGSGGLLGPYGLVFGPDGNLYVSSLFTDQVLRYNGTTGAFLDAFVPAGSGGLNDPFGLVFGPDGNLYVSGFNTNAVLRYEGTTGTFLDAFVPAGSGGLFGPLFLLFRGVPPSCVLTATLPGPPATLQITTQAAFGSGLGTIAVVQQTNAQVVIPPFVPGTPLAVQVTATKQDPGQPAQLTLTVTDTAGNATTCDPVLTEVVGTGGRPLVQTFPDIPPEEDQVTITNGRPGLRSLLVLVNGQLFRAARLADDEVRTLDIATALAPGATTVTLLGLGPAGSRASVLIWDGTTTGGRANAAALEPEAQTRTGAGEGRPRRGTAVLLRAD